MSKKKRIKSVASPFHIRQSLAPWKYHVIQALGVLCFIGVYSYISYRKHRPAPLGNPTDTTIPNLSQFIEGIQMIFEKQRDGSRWIVVDTITTFRRLFTGVLVGASLGTFLGVLMGCYRSIEAFFGWLVSAACKEPATAMLAAFFLFLSTGESLFIGIVTFSTFPMVAQSVFMSAREDVKRESINKMITFGASPMEQIYNLVFKQILPKIIDSVKLSISLAMIGLLAAEMTVGAVGFGHRIKITSHRLDLNVVYLYLLILVFLGYVIDYMFVLLRSWLCPWYGEKVEVHPVPKTATIALLMGGFCYGI